MSIFDFARGFAHIGGFGVRQSARHGLPGRGDEPRALVAADEAPFCEAGEVLVYLGRTPPERPGEAADAAVVGDGAQ